MTDDAAAIIVGRMLAQQPIGFFGGSFDPPHCGHLVVARAAAEAFGLDRVLMAPTGRQPLKADGAEASYADRLEMVRLLCEGMDGLEVSGVEAPRGDGEANFTVDTLKKLRAGLGSHSRVFVIVGIDAFLGIRQWRGTAELLTLAEWIVVTRPGFAMEAVEGMGLSVKERMVVHLLGGVSEMASATLVRERLRSGEGCEDLVPANVLAYIREKHLYGT